MINKGLETILLGMLLLAKEFGNKPIKTIVQFPQITMLPKKTPQMVKRRLKIMSSGFN